MKGKWIKTGTWLLCTALIFNGCGSPQGANDTTGENQDAGYGTYGTQNNDGAMTGTRNNGGTLTNNTGNQGGTNNNMLGRSYNRMFGNVNNGVGLNGNGEVGTTNYGYRGYNNELGNSINQGDGISSLLESQLNQSNIPGAKVLIIGDTVILGLSNNRNNMGAGSTGARLTGMGTTGSGGNESWDINEVRSLVQTSLGTGMLVLTVTDTNALNAIDRVEQSLNSFSSANSAAISSDIELILNNAQSPARRNNTGGANGNTRMDQTDMGQTNTERTKSK
jgi:hypothetical protein